MGICLKERTEETVRIYFEKANTVEIKTVLPQKAKTVEEALEDYQQTLLPGAASYGRTIWLDQTYVGDIWCYGIHLEEESDAMISYCVFEEAFWRKGIATEAVTIFLQEISEKFQLETVGAFTFLNNVASIRVLEKNGFERKEVFEEEGRMSAYFQKKI